MPNISVERDRRQAALAGTLRPFGPPAAPHLERWAVGRRLVRGEAPRLSAVSELYLGDCQLLHPGISVFDLAGYQQLSG